MHEILLGMLQSLATILVWEFLQHRRKTHGTHKWTCPYCEKPHSLTLTFSNKDLLDKVAADHIRSFHPYHTNW